MSRPRNAKNKPKIGTIKLSELNQIFNQTAEIPVSMKLIESLKIKGGTVSLEGLAEHLKEKERIEFTVV